MIYYPISSLVNTITTSVLGVYLLLKGRTRTTRVFSLFCLVVAGWSGNHFFWQLADSPHEALFRCRLLMAFGIFIPTAHLHFTVEFLGLYKKHRQLLFAYYFISALYLLFDLRGYSFIARVEPLLGFPFWPIGGPAFYLYTATFISSVGYSHYLLWRRMRSATGVFQRQEQFLFWGTLVAFIGGCTNFPLCFEIPIPPIGNALVSFYVLLVSYAVLQHQLFDVQVVIKKSLIYSLLVTVLTAGYFGLIYGLERFFQFAFGYQSVWLSLAAFALMALGFQPLKTGIQELVDRLLFRTSQEELIKRMERFEQEAQHAEKMKAVATLAAGMAHEIKNPLTAIKTFVEHLPERHDDPAFREKFVRIVGQEVEKIGMLVQRLLEFAKPSPPRKEPARLSQLMDDTVEFLDDRLLSKGIEVVRSYAARDDEVFVDRAQMRQAFLNILLNSIEAVDGGPSTITISMTAQNGHLEVAVADAGRGIPQQNLSHVLEPFYTTKESGTGLGLSVVYGIVQEHGGRVAIESQPHRGTTVRIQLPAA